MQRGVVARVVADAARKLGRVLLRQVLRGAPPAAWSEKSTSTLMCERASSSSVSRSLMRVSSDLMRRSSAIVRWSVAGSSGMMVAGGGASSNERSLMTTRFRASYAAWSA